MSTTSNSDCIFCKIVKKEIPSDIIFENNKIIVFKDINPKANLHLLVVPKDHIPSLAHLSDTPNNPENNNHLLVLGEALGILDELAKKHGYTNGFRTIINTGPDGGQEVNHLHIHLLAGNLKSFG